MPNRSILAVSLALSTLAPKLNAQCPDGRPLASCQAAPRRDPPLDDRTWLVLPFENKSLRDTASDLAHNASVSLLYEEMSRWQGVRVIPDFRVSDLLRLVPATEQVNLGFATATDLARRAGAGRMVLGSYVSFRGRAFVTATVFEVRGGRQLRVLHDTITGLDAAAALDSLGATVGRLSRGVLAVPTGARPGAGGLGTSSIEAYGAYVAGMAAFNRFALDSARSWLVRALTYDSSFALAHLRLWQVATDTAADRWHLLAAIRLAGGLPPRERTLVEAFAAVERRDRVQLCSAAHRLVADDSASADGWVLLSQCYVDPRVVLEGDTVRVRSDPTRALRAAERAHELAPGSLDAMAAFGSNLAFSAALINGSGPVNPWRMVCADENVGTLACPPQRLMRLSMLQIGDSFAVTSQPWSKARRAPADLSRESVAAWQHRAHQVLEELGRFRQSAPDSWFLALLSSQLGQVTGDTAAAVRDFGRRPMFAYDTSGPNRVVALASGVRLSLARGRMSDAAAYMDSLHQRKAGGLISYEVMFGHFTTEADTGANGRQTVAWRGILAGVMPAGFDTLETRIAARLTGPVRDDFLQLSTLAAFHLRGTRPALDTSAEHPIKRAQAWIARRDTARARAALTEFDRELAARHIATADDGGWLFSAETHLELGDSAVALERVREFARRWVYETAQAGSWILEQFYYQEQRQVPLLWGRTWLLFGDLAMARNQPAEARRAYRMVVGFWEKGDAPVQPMVARAKVALAKLGN